MRYVEVHSPFTSATFWVHLCVALELKGNQRNFIFSDEHLSCWPVAPRSIQRGRSELLEAGFLTAVQKPSPGRPLKCRFEYPEVPVNGRHRGGSVPGNARLPGDRCASYTSNKTLNTSLASSGGGKAERKRAETPFPVGQFVITASMRSWLEENNYTHLNIRLETERFRDHALSVDRRVRDWVAAWRNWIRKAAEFNPGEKKLVQDSIKPLAWNPSLIDG